MSNNFKAFESGIRIAPGLAADPLTGKTGEIYWNTTSEKLRLCTSSSPLVWVDLIIDTGTVNNATLRWDTVADAWVENTTVQTSTNQISGQSDLIGHSLTIKAGDSASDVGGSMMVKGGDTSNAGSNGGSVQLIGGTPGLGGNKGSILVDSPVMNAYDGLTGNDWTIRAGDSADAGVDGGELTLKGGAPGAGANRGDVDIVGNRVVLSGVDAINVNTQLSSDPSTPLTGDIYYNSTQNRMKIYNGTIWDFLAQKGITPIDLWDTTNLTYPLTDATLIDGVTVVSNTKVLFAALTVDAGVYSAFVSGGIITWTLMAYGQNPNGTFTVGDKLFIKYGTSNSLKSINYNGSAWYEFLAKSLNDYAIPMWSTDRWIENTDIRINTSSLYRKDDVAADAIKASNVTIRPSNKTAGTGDGGDLVLNSGISVGGLSGNVILSGYNIRLDAQLASDPISSNATDIYYNSATKRFKFYNGLSWSDISKLGICVVDMYSSSDATLPLTTATTVDGITITNGMKVLFTSLGSGNQGIYVASVAGIDITWTFDPCLQSNGYGFTFGDRVVVRFGTIYALQNLIYTTGWIQYLARGTANNSFPIWDGTKWIENTNLRASTTTISRKDDVAVDAVKADDLSVHAANKTAGTGDGGDLVLSSGTSAGGLSGDVVLSGEKINLDTIHASDPAVGNKADIYFNDTTKQFKYFDGTIWRSIGSGSGLFKVIAHDIGSLTLPTGNPLVLDGVTIVADDLVLFTALSSGNNQIYKAVGTAGDITGWTSELAFDGSATPTDGDFVIVQQGTLFADQVGKYTGSFWSFNDKVRYFNGAIYLEQGSLVSAVINDNQSAALALFTTPFLGSENMIIDYSIIRDTNKEVGTIYLSTEGVNVAISTVGAGLGSTGITFSSAIATSDIELRYTSTNTGTAGTMKYSIRKWAD